jgi:hypothetical protein
MSAQTNNELFSAMVGNKPLKTYKKTILGRIYVTALNMLTGTPIPEGVILTGDPRKNEPGTMFDVFSEQEDYFFKKMNRVHFDEGRLVEHSRTTTERERTIEEFSDEELKTLINKPFLALQNTLNKTTSVATLFRIQTIAEQIEKSEKVMRAINSRLSEVQEGEIVQLPDKIESEL